MERLRVIAAALTSNMSTQSTPAVQIPGWPPGLFNATNFRYEDTPHPSIFLRVPGLTYESFDIYWNPKISSVMLASVSSRDCAFCIPLPRSNSNEPEKQQEEYFLDWPFFTSNFFHYVIGTEFVMSRAMYDNKVPKWPVDMKFTLGNVGSSSLTLTSDFYACNGEKEWSTPLWTNTAQLVAVDKTTRKASRLPDWYQRKYKGRGCMNKGLIIKPFKRPAVTYAHPCVVQKSDCGRLFKHSSWTAFADWAIDALQAALLLQGDPSYALFNPEAPSGETGYSPFSAGAPPGESPQSRAVAALRGMTLEIFIRGVRKMQAVFLSECLHGDALETHLWQEDGGEKELVYFSVTKDGKDVCQMKMWFFDDSSQ